MRHTLFATAALAALAPAAAMAAHISTGSWAYTSVRSEIDNRPGGTAGAAVWIWGGTIVYTDAGATPGGSASFDAGPLTPGATTVWASAFASVDGQSGMVTASASLDRGEIKASTANTGSRPQSSDVGTFREDIWFTNTTADWLPITYTLSIDGAASGPLENANWQLLNKVFTPESSGCSAAGACVGYAPGVTLTTAFEANFDSFGGLSFRDTLGGPGIWTLVYGPGHDVAARIFDLTMVTTLWVPPGETTLTLEPKLTLLCRGTGVCDFGSTSKARFGPAPAGLSWTSASGVFLTGLIDPPTPTPAPAMAGLLGLGALLLAARRRRT